MAVAFHLYGSTTGLVPCSATPTTFGDLRAANGQGQQRRRITSVQPPSGLQEWLKMFQVTMPAEVSISSSSPFMVYEGSASVAFFLRIHLRMSLPLIVFSCNDKWASALRNNCSLFQQKITALTGFLII